MNTPKIVGWLIVVIVMLYAVVVVPRGGDVALMISGSIYASYGILALSLALIWGYGGILSFGQAAFFGVAGYAYAIAGLNFDNTILAAFIAVVAAAGFAALLGYFMFWGRISDVYLGVITLTVALILYRFINQTAGEEWKIGVAPLGGFNGIPSTPVLAPPGHPDQPLLPEHIYVLSVVALFVCYVLCEIVVTTRFGRAVVAIRENEVRAELLGYDMRRYKLGMFTLGGGMAGVAGVLFANSVFVSPNMFSLQTNGQILIWVIVGGLGTFVGPVIGCFLLLTLSNWLGTLNAGPAWSFLDPNLVMGIVLTLCVIFFRKGLVPTLSDWLQQGFSFALRGTRVERIGDVKPAKERS